MRWLAFLMWVVAAVLLGTTPVAAQQANTRFALVIANEQYQAFDRLVQATTDGNRIANALSATGFVDASGSGTVQIRRNLGLAEMRREIAAFQAVLAQTGPEAFGVLYFSGHGVAVGSGGDVVMVPVDSAQSDLVQALPLARAAVTRDLMRSGARNVLVILDMCRNAVDIPIEALAATPPDGAAQPTAVQPIAGTRGLRRVLRNPAEEIRPDQGYLVAYSTSGGSVAFDNGIFSRILAEEIQRPRQNIAEALKRTSDRVAISSGNSFQKPTFDYGLQGEPPCFVSCNPEGASRFYDCASCPWMLALPAGTTAFGSPPSEIGRGDDEALQQQRTIDRGFALAVFELTVAEWTACVNDGACAPLGDWSRENPNPLIPATSISYDDAQAYLTWLRQISGRNYRLPTEEEWEYASPAQSDGPFPWGASITPSDANYDHTASYDGSPRAPYRGYPEAVNAYPPNRFGLYQMLGNVWEWTSGCADQACREHVVRGGSFESVPGELRAANRFRLRPQRRQSTVGLRVARDLDPDEIGLSAVTLTP